MRQMAAEEIFTSEQTYVEQLNVFIENYKKPIQASKIVDDRTIKDLFANVEGIYSTVFACPSYGS